MITGGDGGDLIYGGAGDDSIDGGDDDDSFHADAGADTLVGGDGFDSFVGGEGADLIDVTDGAAGLQRDQVEIDFETDFGDVIVGFSTEAPTSGGDELDIRDLLLPAGTLSDAVAQGYLSFDGDATQTTLSADFDGAAGAGAPVVMCTFEGIGFVDSATSETMFADNIFVV